MKTFCLLSVLPAVAALEYAPVKHSGRSLATGQECTDAIAGLEWTTDVVCGLGDDLTNEGITFGGGMYVAAQTEALPYRFETGIDLNLGGSTGTQDFSVPAFQFAIGSDISITEGAVCANPYFSLGFGEITLDGQSLQGAYDSGNVFLFGDDGLLPESAQPCIQANVPYCLASQSGNPGLAVALRLTGSDLCLTFSGLDFDAEGNGGFYLDLTLEVAHEENFNVAAEAFCTSNAFADAVCQAVNQQAGTSDAGTSSAGLTQAWVNARDQNMDSQFIEFTRTQSIGDVLNLAGGDNTAVSDGRRHLQGDMITSDGAICFGSGGCENVQRPSAGSMATPTMLVVIGGAVASMLM